MISLAPPRAGHFLPDTVQILHAALLTFTLNCATIIQMNTSPEAEHRSVQLPD